jgi:hypothetical protein
VVSWPGCGWDRYDFESRAPNHVEMSMREEPGRWVECSSSQSQDVGSSARRAREARRLREATGKSGGKVEMSVAAMEVVGAPSQALVSPHGAATLYFLVVIH